MLVYYFCPSLHNRLTLNILVFNTHISHNVFVFNTFEMRSPLFGRQRLEFLASLVQIWVSSSTIFSDFRSEAVLSSFYISVGGSGNTVAQSV
jgi:hypothetical protein